MKINLKCNTNCHNHIDYRIPITKNKSDFRTSYYVGHEFFYPIPQNFDCRIKAKPKPNLLWNDIKIKEENTSNYRKEYGFKSKQEDATLKYEPGHQLTEKRHFQEGVKRDPPLRFHERVSEMRDSYGFALNKFPTEKFGAPVTESHCEISGLASPLQPSIPPHQPGYTKYLDIYMTQNKLDLKPFDDFEFGRSRKDLPTAYNILGTYKKSRHMLGEPQTGNKEMYDKVMRPQYPSKNLSRGWTRVPHRGMQSEYGGSYTTQTFSDVYPYLNSSGVTFGCSSMDDCGPWQIYAIPGMYCTDYCHIGAPYSVKSILNCVSNDKLPGHSKPKDLSLCCD